MKDAMYYFLFCLSLMTIIKHKIQSLKVVEIFEFLHIASGTFELWKKNNNIQQVHKEYYYLPLALLAGPGRKSMTHPKDISEERLVLLMGVWPWGREPKHGKALAAGEFIPTSTTKRVRQWPKRPRHEGKGRECMKQNSVTVRSESSQ